ncbi:hypothetical protein CAPTEDRAFT_223929 [Capitella teleta]|uniref:Uncharacterized protein n=1 Tax=Capitella teleta TaxID=283909 RepID=R7VB44_CAPTE|nr:hypothetical protein CAPTEDRAFT_223929 [Capitella teleta]|eukprot:ELU15747.1 hypothetical protein CAPTEDRAFT_223929 [Capitella teleta]
MTTYEDFSSARSSPSASLQNLRLSSEEAIYETTVESAPVEVDAVGGASSGFYPLLPIEFSLKISALCCGVVQLGAGLGMGCLAMVITSMLKNRADYTLDQPMIWWSGCLPLLVGILGIYTFTTSNRKHFYRWGLCGMLVLLAECALLGALGAFDIARFNVWPFFGRNHGRAICEMLLPGRCYCQDYYHGKWSEMEIAGVQYIHEDIVWRDSGFHECSDVRLISAIFYLHHILFATFAIIAIASFALAIKATACGPADPEEFQRLQDSFEFEDTFVINETSVRPLRIEFPNSDDDNEDT